MTDVDAIPARLSRADREARILDTAQHLFYARGVHEVGMDELVTASGLAKASVYRIFPTKDELIAAYLRRLAGSILGEIDAVAQQHPSDPARALRSVLDAIEKDLQRPEFRGCAFNNASIEFADPEHPARVEARRYRAELAARLMTLARSLAGARAGQALGQQLAVLIDGAYTSAAHLGANGPAATGLRLARQLVRQAAAR